MKNDGLNQKLEPGRLFDDERLRRAFATFIAHELRSQADIEVPRSGLTWVDSATVAKKQPKDATIIVVKCVAHDDDCAQPKKPRYIRVISDERTFEITVKEVSRNF